MIKRRALAAGALCGGIFAAYFTMAGPLNPPAGAVAPTDRFQLSDALTPLPHTITQPGSYVLTGPLTGVSGEHGIIIAADDVTLDLNGFALVGAPGSLNGVMLNTNTARCTIRNGVIRSWGGNGIDAPFGDLGDVIAHHTRLVDLQIAQNAQDGAALGDFAYVEGCIASENGFGGIRIGQEGVIKDCTSNNNGQVGLSGSNRALIVNCVSNDNGTHGITILRGMVRGCLSAFNAMNDIDNPFPAQTTLIDNHTD